MSQKKNPNAQALGSLGGKARAENLSRAEAAKIASKGGKARAAKLSDAELSRIAKLAVAARERKRKGESRKCETENSRDRSFALEIAGMSAIGNAEISAGPSNGSE